MKRRLLSVVMFIVATIVFSSVLFSTVHGVEPFYNITGLYLRSDEAQIGDKLYVDLYMTKDDTTQITGYFMNDARSYVSLPLMDVNTNNPYFEISSYMQAGTTYTITALEVSDSAGRFTYGTTPGSNNYMNLLGKNVVRINKPILVTSFALIGDNVVKPDGEIKLELKTDQEVGLTTITIQNKNIPSMKALVSITPNTITTIELEKLGSQHLGVGEYQITDVFFNPDVQNKYIHYSINPQDGTTRKLDTVIEFSITNNVPGTQVNEDESPDSILEEIKLNTNSAALNEKVGVTIGAKKQLSSATLIFSNGSESMTVSLKDLNTDSPFFVVPFTTGEGLYKLNYAILKDSDNAKYQYRDGNDYYGVMHFDFNSELDVKNTVKEGQLLNLDNGRITSEIIEKIKGLEGNIVIEINAENNPVISKELFEAIENSDKTLVILHDDYEWVFNGLDIEDPKQIDVSVKLSNITDADNLDDVVSSGIVLEFPENGNLPGKCLIKIYDTQYISRTLNHDNVNIYYYDEKSGKYEIIELNKEFDEKGFYEFYMTHNSSYIMTKETIDGRYLLTQDGSGAEKVFMIVAIALAVVLVLSVAIMIAVVMKMKHDKQATITNCDAD